jgi:hypothetical protein
MDQVFAALDATWRILLVGLLLGAGLPTVFALGIRSLAWGVGGEAGRHDDGIQLRPHPLGRVVAYLIFALVILVVLLGVGYIVAHGLGWTVTFNGLLPVVTPKH